MQIERLFKELGELEKLKQEKNGVFDYALTNIKQHNINLSLIVHDVEYIFIASFPFLYPAIPPIIKKVTEFNTQHSYTNGVMCLKHGPDNWSTQLLLKDQILELFALLEIENPLGSGEKNISESGENLEFGQLLRRYRDFNILFINKKIFNMIKESVQKIHATIVKLYFIENKYKKNYYFISSINNEILQSYRANRRVNAYCLVDDSSNIINNIIKNREIEFKKLSNRYNGYKAFVIITSNSIFLMHKYNKVVEVAISQYTEEEINKRLNIQHDILCKQISIIGLGSVGSRVLMDLARAGFNNFLLIDSDIFLPHNLIRHELTIKDIGKLKIEALKEKIRSEINPNINIENYNAVFAGQESAEYTEFLSKEIAKSNIIIDCTANNNVLNILDIIVEKYDLNYVSGTVLPGTIGTTYFIRKKFDSFSLLDIYHHYSLMIEDLKIEIPNQEIDYGGIIGETQFIASMSDCTIVAGFIGKIVLSILNPNDLTSFPNAIYLISNSNYAESFKQLRVYSKGEITKLKRITLELDPETINIGKKIYENSNT